MSYRSIKRMLGESSLERKCRILFGVCLMLLFGGAFLAADRVAEQLVYENTRYRAHDNLTNLLVRHHFTKIVITRDRSENFSHAARDLSRRLGMLNLPHETFPLSDPQKRDMMTYTMPREFYETLSRERQKQVRLATETDERMLKELRRKLAEYQAELAEATLETEGEPVDPLDALKERSDGTSAPKLSLAPLPNRAVEEAGDGSGLGKELQGKDFNPIFAEVRPSGSGQYHYYELFEVKDTCLICHFPEESAGGLDGIPMDVANLTPTEEPPLYVAVKVIMPDEQAQAAINWIRAILISVAIVTVFFAMVTSYVIVRYVIVKPLRHLTDVSDEISRGKTELRADLQTGDEFEKLAASFNRMLRHLIDTQKELRSVNTDLDRKVDELAQLNMRLYEVNQLKGEFLANMSHELRTPLNSIIGFSEVLQGIDSLTEKEKRFAGNIRKSGRLLLEMINDILDLAKIDAGRMDVKPAHFKIAPVIEELVDMVRALATEKNIDMQVHCDVNDQGLYQDQVKIQQILTNLLSNAIKFTPEGGRITIEARRLPSDAFATEPTRHDRLIIAVSDTGVGIAQEDRAIIFEKFRQGTGVLGRDNLTREYSGTGLGLSIVKELCRLLGGEVSVESEVGKGSTFTVSLPWECSDEPPRSSDLSSRLDELTRSRRVDLDKQRWRGGAHESPESAKGVSSTTSLPVNSGSANGSAASSAPASSAPATSTTDPPPSAHREGKPAPLESEEAVGASTRSNSNRR